MLREGDRMKIETETRISQPLASYELTITLRHNRSYKYPFHVQVGCVDDYLTEQQLRDVRKVINAALRKLQAISK